MGARIINLELSDQDGNIATNKTWDAEQKTDFDFKMGIKVEEQNPEGEGTIQVLKPRKIYISVTSNCNIIELIKGPVVEGYSAEILEVNNTEKSITFKGPGKCLVRVIGSHADGSTHTVTWKFNVLEQEWTQDAEGVVGDAPKFVRRDTVLEIVPSNIATQVNEEVTYDVMTNGTTIGQSITISSTDGADKVLIDVKARHVKILKAGTFNITFGAQYRKAKTTTKQINYVIIPDKPYEPEKNAVIIQLFNKDTQRTTKIATSNNDSTDDVVYILPENSGTLISDGDLKKTVSIIERPIIINPISGTTNFTGMVTSSPFNVLFNYKEEHVKTLWQVALTRTFDKIILEYESTHTDNLTKFHPSLMGDVKVFIRCKYFGLTNDSFWSVPIEVTFGGHGYDSLKKPIRTVSDNPLDGTYYGTVPHSELIDNYDYRGTYDVIKDCLEYITQEEVVEDKPLGSVKKGVDYGQNMKIGYQVLHPKPGETKLSLWYCKKEMTAEVFRKNPPGPNSQYWALDERDNLLTPLSLVDKIGIGIIDPWARKPRRSWVMPDDGYSYGKKLLTPLVNHTEGWLKFGYRGKILYTTKKPICMQIAWTDLAKRDAVYGNRTIRIGRRLYWIRLLTEEEYTMLFTNLTNNKFENWKEQDLLLNSGTWIEDFQESLIRYRMISKGTKEAVDPKFREGVWRPVLELIPENAEPHLHIPGLPLAENELFRYDFYSDTGYFGVVKGSKVIDMEALKTKTATSAAVQTKDVDFLKFYWHGMIILAAMENGLNAITHVQARKEGMLHGCDMGGTGKKTVEIDYNGRKIRMIVATLTDIRIEPFAEEEFNFHQYKLGEEGPWPQSKVLVKQPLDQELGKYSQHNELMYRICAGYLGFTETINDVNQWYSDFMELHNGYQLGHNWDELKPISLFKINTSTNPMSRAIGTIGKLTFNPNATNIQYPEALTEEGTTTEENLTAWCKKYSVDFEWFKTKYTNWATTKLTEQFVKQVYDAQQAVIDQDESYTPPTKVSCPVIYLHGMAGVDYHDNGFDSQAGIKIGLYLHPSRPKLKL